MGGKIIGGRNSLVDVVDAPVDIDIALDDMLGREFADCLNEWLSTHGRETHSVGLVLKNPEKSKHLETATMKVGKFWIDFVNLRAEEYTEDSRIPDLMRIGTAQEDAFRRDLTINALFYNINTGRVEDITGRGFDHLKKGIIATPLPPLTTLLDDPLRVLRSVRFAARLRFGMDEALREAARHENVRLALAQKVSRERIGSEVDLMFRSQDPVGAMRLLINLELDHTVFPIPVAYAQDISTIFENGLYLLSTTHDHLCDCKTNTPVWCESKRAAKAAMNGVNENLLINDEEARRKLWYASFLKPFLHYAQNPYTLPSSGRSQGKKANRSAIMKLMVDDLKRPLRDADAVERIMKAADEITLLIDSGCDLSATTVLLSEIRVEHHEDGFITCHMESRDIQAETEEDPIWLHAMEYRLLTSGFLRKVGSLWRAALILSLSEQLAKIDQDFNYTIEGDVFDETSLEIRDGIIQQYDCFAASLQQLGLIGIWSQKPLLDGVAIKAKGILPNIPRGPIFKEIMDKQLQWMTIHPGGSKEPLVKYMREVYPDFI
uniref:Poly A polymerase head domain-containing protein n=1 Tax=Eucampia antarctica TaxID=49252 RepID=A0A7S2R939_9STRA|mmetsp:Transcript_18890/g.18177  ORF Transcript_18890/g.18177 Transcript_18890/m.18177 type:complete len:548 (+) Transcript_18890:2-1645(+)